MEDSTKRVNTLSLSPKKEEKDDILLIAHHFKESSKKVRHNIKKKTTTTTTTIDSDTENVHPRLLAHFCKQNDIETPMLN